MKRPRLATGLFWLCCLPTQACDSSPPPAAPPQLTAAPTAAAKTKPAETQRVPAATRPTLQIPGRTRQASGTSPQPSPHGLAKSPPAAGPDGQARPGQAPKKRDLENELRVALQGLPSCLPPMTTDDAPQQISVQLRANVTHLGRVTRAEVTSAGMNAEALDCARRAVLRVRFRQPIDHAPRVVSTQVLLEQRSGVAPK